MTVDVLEHSPTFEPAAVQWRHTSIILQPQLKAWLAFVENKIDKLKNTNLFVDLLILCISLFFLWTYNNHLYIYIYIYSHLQTDCFVVSQLFSVTWLYTRDTSSWDRNLTLRQSDILSPRYHQAKGKRRGFWVYIHMYAIGHRSAQLVRRALHLCVSGNRHSLARVLPTTLIPPCLTLSIIRYGSRVKWSNPGNGVAPSPTPWCSSYRKGSLRVTLDYGR